MIAVSDQETFGNRFKLCQLTWMYRAIVSTRGVWMTHWWESYSNGKYPAPTEKDPDNYDNYVHPNDPAFNQRVLMFLRGETVTPGDALSNGSADYEAPQRPAINPNLFNERGDQTKVFIYTPVKAETMYKVNEINRENKLKYLERYGKKNREVHNAISKVLGKRAKIVIMPYKPLNSADPVEGPLIGQNYRGALVFQYDPDSDGKGKRAWRILNEHRTY